MSAVIRLTTEDIEFDDNDTGYKDGDDGGNFTEQILIDVADNGYMVTELTPMGEYKYIYLTSEEVLEHVKKRL